jgi:hypothetical protein
MARTGTGTLRVYNSRIQLHHCSVILPFQFEELQNLTVLPRQQQQLVANLLVQDGYPHGSIPRNVHNRRLAKP